MKPLIILAGAVIAGFGFLADSKKVVDADAKIMPNNADGETPQNKPAADLQKSTASENVNDEQGKPIESKDDSDDHSD